MNEAVGAAIVPLRPDASQAAEPTPEAGPDGLPADICERGFVPIFRCLRDHPVRRDLVAWWVYTELAGRARFARDRAALRQAPGGRRYLRLAIGQAVCGIRDLAGTAGVGEKAIRTALERLESWGLVALNRTHQGTIVTLHGYAEFWSRGEGEGQTRGRTTGRTEGT